MKLKSYLRGLGLGMIVTTIILVLAFKARNTDMTDAQIKERAYELGMVETSLYGGNSSDKETEESTEKPTEDETEKPTEESTEKPTEDETEKPTEKETEKPTEKATEKPVETTAEKETEKSTTEKATEKPVETTAEKPTEKPTEKATEKPTEKPTEKATEKPTSPQVITVVLEDITSADKASKILKEAGVIQDVESFNEYLSKEGLATKVGEGTFEFKSGMSFEEIASIITRRKIG